MTDSVQSNVKTVPSAEGGERGAEGKVMDEWPRNEPTGIPTDDQRAQVKAALLAETRARNVESAEVAYRCAMRRSSHKRWQRAREWDGDWHCPVPVGEPVSIWHKGHDHWTYHLHADRADWAQVRAYRLEHGTPYPATIAAPKPIPPELAGTMPPVLQFRFDRIDAALARIEAMLPEPAEPGK